MTDPAQARRPAPWRAQARLELAVHALTAIVFATIVVALVPGVRPHRSYNLVFDGILSNVAYALSAVVCWLRLRRNPTDRRRWLPLSLGLALYCAGNVYWTIAVRPLHHPPYPSLADGLWLAFYPCAFVAVLLMTRSRAQRFPVSLWLDGVVGGLAVSAGVAAVVLAPALRSTTGSIAAVATTAAYPLVDILLLVVVVAMLALWRWRPPTGIWLLALGVVLLILADSVSVVKATDASFRPSGLSGTIWVLATLVMALAPGWADRPSARQVPTWAMMAVPVLSTSFALVLLVYHQQGKVPTGAVALATATVVAALGRLVATFREATDLAHSHQLALTDELTGLPNRRALYNKTRELAEERPDGWGGALLLLDLDRFKEVNDSLGHDAGDELLRQVATRLSTTLDGKPCLLARLGGDEFAVLLIDANRVVAQQMAHVVRRILARPFRIDEVSVRTDASVGVALAPVHGRDAGALLRHADIAMYQAKERRNGYSVYADDTEQLTGRDRLRRIEELRDVILSRRLEVHYQPKINARSGEVVGLEALVRWAHPTDGLLYPHAFLPLVEDAGLMHELTLAVLSQSLDQIAGWRAAGRLLPVAVNLSPSSLVDADLPERIWELVSGRNLPPDVLGLEITEDVLLHDRERARDVLVRLRELGICVAIDDFGTGYSSLAYLRELPIDELKLDRSFVFSMTEDPRAIAIVRSTIDLAHSLGMRMVAEGVEDEATLRYLTEAGCDQAQGFYFSKALPPKELEHWLDNYQAGTDYLCEAAS